MTIRRQNDGSHNHSGHCYETTRKNAEPAHFSVPKLTKPSAKEQKLWFAWTEQGLYAWRVQVQEQYSGKFRHFRCASMRSKH